MVPIFDFSSGLFLFYGCILGFNILLSLILSSKTDAPHYKLQAAACFLLIVAGIAQGLVADEAHIYQALACSLLFFGWLFFTELLCLIVGIEFHRRNYYILYFFGVSSSLVLHYLGIHPGLMVLPILIAGNFPMLQMGLHTLIKKKNVSFVAKFFALSGVLSALHNLDFAYAYTHPEWLILGHTLAVLGMFSLTTLSTGAVLETLAQENTEIKMMAEYGVMIANATRLNSLGQMANGLAHEINNPLAIIQMHAHQLKRILHPDQETAIKGASIIEETVFRINRIITSLRSFGRDAGSDPFQDVSFISILENTLLLVEKQSEAYGIEIQKGQFSDALVRCRPVQISQVILNLINNSFDAVEHNADKKWINLQVKNDNGTVSLIVSDSGKPIAPEIQDKIFHPFFTTKDVGEGAGLGLSSSLGIVQANHGTLALKKDAPHTTFTLTLPKTKPAEQSIH